MLKAEHIYFRTYEKQSRRSSFSLQCFYLLCPLFFFSLLTCLKQRFYLDKHNTTVKMWSQTFCFFSQFFCAHRWQKQKSVLYNPFWSADKFAGKILYLALFFFVCFFFFSYPVSDNPDSCCKLQISAALKDSYCNTNYPYNQTTPFADKHLQNQLIICIL